MKVYKGTDKDIKCRGYQFTPGVAAEEDEAELCRKGFHACEAPIDVFNYYAPVDGSRYFEAELKDVSPERHSDDTKVVGKKIILGAELTIPMLCKAQFQYVKEHTTTEHTDPDRATAGDGGAATAGDGGAATAGDGGAATAGDGGAATSRGSVSVGENGCALARSKNPKARGGKGAVLILCKEKHNSHDIEDCLTFIIDCENYRLDVWYTLENGNVKEAEND